MLGGSWRGVSLGVFYVFAPWTGPTLCWRQLGSRLALWAIRFPSPRVGPCSTSPTWYFHKRWNFSNFLIRSGENEVPAQVLGQKREFTSQKDFRFRRTLRHIWCWTKTRINHTQPRPHTKAKLKVPRLFGNGVNKIPSSCSRVPRYQGRNVTSFFRKSTFMQGSRQINCHDAWQFLSRFKTFSWVLKCTGYKFLPLVYSCRIHQHIFVLSTCVREISMLFFV